MRISDVLAFNKERYFNGAIQAEWFYDTALAREISTSYVFHGPRYYGVKQEDISSRQHALMDTISFSEMLARATKDVKKNGLMMTIAGYGTGKSHLAVTLGALVSGHDRHLREDILENISAIDSKLGKEIRECLGDDRNLVLMLNGMNNFNLDYEIMKCAKQALKQHGIDPAVLKEVTKAYSIAEHFLESTFDMLATRYEFYADQHGLKYSSADGLRVYLKERMQRDQKAFAVVDNVYKEINGQSIQWESGISAGEILTFLCQRFIDKEHIFDRILILFDEFGRYIEYAAQNPTVASDSALQQVFEAVQNSRGEILHVAFIQSELSAYLARIPNTSNITRYVGRYENSEKYYLSSNFETIIANLIQRKNEREFRRCIVAPINRNRYQMISIKNSLNRWAKASAGKSVWSDEDMFMNVICQGCYPLHPITTWMLSSMSSWMQQRSTISFAEEMFKNIGHYTLDEEGYYVRYIRPSDIIESQVMNEMVSSEEKGLVQSQNCLLYREIISKIGDSLTDEERDVLNAALIINIGRFECFNKDDYILAVEHCTCLEEAVVKGALFSLENAYGVITFNDQSKRYDLLAETNGKNEYKRVFLRHKTQIHGQVTISQTDENVEKIWELGKVHTTAFAQIHDIRSVEWGYGRRLIAAEDFEKYADLFSSEVDSAIDGEKARGLQVLLYTNKDAYYLEAKLTRIYKEKHLCQKPILVIVLSDTEKELIGALEDYWALRQFTSSERERFKRFVDEEYHRITVQLTSVYQRLLRERLVVEETGIAQKTQKMTVLCMQKFEECYTKPIPFMFDGFEKKITPTIKKYYADVALNIASGTICQSGSFNMLSQDLKNRILGLIGDGAAKSWKMLSPTRTLHAPHNDKVAPCFEEARKELGLPGEHTIQGIFGKYAHAPYGMNHYSLSLMVVAFLALYDGVLIIRNNEGQKIDLAQMVQIIFLDKKGLQYAKLLKLSLAVVSEGANNAVKNICQRISENIYVEECDILSEQLEQLLKGSSVSASLNGEIASARLRVKEGQRLKTEIYNRLRSAEDILSGKEKKVTLISCASALKSIATYTGEIAEGSNYHYSEEYGKLSKACFAKAERWIKAHGISSAKTISCEVTELSLFKLQVKNRAKIFKENGFEELARAMMKRVEEVEKEVLLIQKYSDAIEKCRVFVVQNRVGAMGTLEACLTISGQIKMWKQYWEEASDLPRKQREKYLADLATIATSCNQAIAEGHENYLKLQQYVNEASNEEELGQIEYLVRLVSKFGASQDEMDVVKQIQKKAHTYREYWSAIAITRANIEQIKRDALVEFDELPFSKFAEDHIGKVDKTLKEKAKMWIRDNLPNQVAIDKMSAVEAINRKRMLEAVPSYLDEGDLKKIAVIKEKLENRIRTCKFEAIEALFLELAEDEQWSCLGRLQELSKSEPAEEAEFRGNLPFKHEELVLLMYVYCRFKKEWFSPASIRVDALSRLLKKLPYYSKAERSKEKFRNTAGIDLQIRTLAQCDPECPRRQTLKPSRAMNDIWYEYQNNFGDLEVMAKRIVCNAALDENDYPEIFA